MKTRVNVLDTQMGFLAIEKNMTIDTIVVNIKETRMKHTRKLIHDIGKVSTTKNLVVVTIDMIGQMMNAECDLPIVMENTTSIKSRGRHVVRRRINIRRDIGWTALMKKLILENEDCMIVPIATRICYILEIFCNFILERFCTYTCFLS